jgi:hypothetical protein
MCADEMPYLENNSLLTSSESSSFANSANHSPFVSDEEEEEESDAPEIEEYTSLDESDKNSHPGL